MAIVAKVLIALVALEHIYFLVLEMFLWEKPRTRKAFGMTAEAAGHTKVLAGNQGLYNGFLAAGLVWSLLAPAAYAKELAIFFLPACSLPGCMAASRRTSASGCCRRCRPRSGSRRCC
jgi:putative membrane protein